MKWICVLIICLLYATSINALMIIPEKSPFPDYYGTIKNRIDCNIVDGKKIPLNNYHYKTPARIGVIPNCNNKEDCVLLVTSVDFYLDDKYLNKEKSYPFDLKYPANANSAEDVDEIPNGYHIIKAIVTNVDGTTYEMKAQFLSGTPSMQQLDDLSLFLTTSDKQILIAWDKNTLATSYEIFMHHVERDEIVGTVNKTQPEDTSVTQVNTKIKLPRTGHYILYFRSIVAPLPDTEKEAIDSKITLDELKEYLNNTNICDIENITKMNLTLAEMKVKAKEVNRYCSDMTASTDSENGQVNLKSGEVVNKGWMIYVYPGSPSNSGITQD